MTDWIPSQVGLKDHPKTRRLARTLDDSVPHVIGYLHCLWYWTLAYAPDGDVNDFDPEDLADAAGWDGDAELFVDALLTCGGRKPGFLSKEDGRLVVHDWEDNQGDAFKARIQAAAKKRAQRAQQGQDTSDVPTNQDSVPEDGDTVPTNQDLARAKDRPDRPIEKHSSESDSESSDESNGFDEFWKLYPRKDAKGQARKAWATAIRKVPPGRIIEGLRARVASILANEPRYRPLPSTWLNGERWEDEIPRVGLVGKPPDQSPWSARKRYALYFFESHYWLSPSGMSEEEEREVKAGLMEGRWTREEVETWE